MAPENSNTSLLNIFNLHSIVWVLAIFLLGGIAYMLYTKDGGFRCGYTNEVFECGFLDEVISTSVSKNMTGYFYSLDENGDTVCVSEQLKLSFFSDRFSVEGRSGGNVHDKNGNLISSGWIQKGFRHGNNLALSYITDSNAPTGAGIYYLMESGSEYAGYWMGLDFPLGHKVQCPYVLTETAKPEDESCEERWPNVFDGKPCKILKNANM